MVTGGGAGIGRSTALALAATGVRVHICDIDEIALASVARSAPHMITGSIADVGNARDVEALFSRAKRILGGLDILVNNVGIAGPVGGIDTIKPAALEHTFRVNLLGQFYCASRAVPLMKMMGGGVIVNVSSVAGCQGYAYRSAYSASKWGVIGLTKSLAIELGPMGIRVNAVCPGAVAGPPLDRAIAKRAAARGVPCEVVRAEYEDQASMRAVVAPEDVAHSIVFLCSDHAKTVSGQVIGVDGNTVTLR